MSRWQLGNPSLILDLPGNPRAGGVDWHPTSGLSVLPTSWSSESDDLRVEVSSQFGSQDVEAMLGSVSAKLGGAPKTSNLKISGYSALRGEISGKPLVAIQAEGRGWIIVATPKTGSGVAQVKDLLDSIYVERSGEKRWVQRSLGHTRMNAELPFELAPKAVSVNEGSSYELHFDDFRIDASVSLPSVGMKIDFNKTITSYIEGEKKISGTSDFKSKRERIKRDQLDGEVVTLEMTRGTKKYKVATFFAQVDDSLLRMDVSGRADSASHDSNVDRILNSLRVSSVNFAKFAPRQVGSEGVWFDVPKEFEPPTSNSSSRTYTCFPGSFQLDVRFTETDATTGYNADQLLDFLEVKYKSGDGIKDYKAERFTQFVNGLETRILKTQHKRPGRGDHTMKYAMAIFAPGQIIVAEMISEEQQKGYLERVIDTAKIELKAPDGWSRKFLGDSGVSILAGELDIQKPKPNQDLETLTEINMAGEGLVLTVTESKFKENPKSPSAFVLEIFNIVKSSANATGKITSQQPIEIGNHTGLRAGIELELAQGKLVGDIVVLKKDKQVLAMIVVADVKNSKALIRRYTVINSLK